MSLQEAFEKYEIDPTQVITEAKVFQGMSDCCIYEGIANHANNNPAATKINLRTEFLTLLFGLEKKTDYHFIRLSDSICEPFAKKGDILVVLKGMKAVNGDFVITRFKESIIIFQYFIAGSNEALFKGSNDIEIRLKGKDREQIEILGIMKQKISNAM